MDELKYLFIGIIIAFFIGGICLFSFFDFSQEVNTIIVSICIAIILISLWFSLREFDKRIEKEQRRGY